MDRPADTLAPWNRVDLEQLLGIVEGMKCALPTLI